MNTVKNIAKNTAVLVLGRIVSSMLSLILVIFIARYLGVAAFGKYSFAFAFVGIFGILANFGLDTYTIREVSRDKSETAKYFGNMSIIRFILSIIVFCLIIITINLLNYPKDTTFAVYLFGIWMIINSLSDVCRSIFNAFERMEYETLVNIVERVVTTSLGITALFLGYGLIPLISIFLIGASIKLILSIWLATKRFTKPDFSIDFGFWRDSLRQALPFALTGIFVTIYFQIDTVMLSMMKGDEVVGWYNAAYRMVGALGFIPGAFIAAIFPVMSQYFISSKKSIQLAFQKSFKYMFMLGLPIGVGTTILADRFILLIYGSEFIPSITALQILIWALVIVFQSMVLGAVLGSINKQGINTLLTGVNAIFNVTLNLLLIPTFSYVGAAIATVATELLGFSFALYIVHKHYPLDLRDMFGPILSCVVMGSFLLYFGFLPLYLVVPIAILFYFGSLYLVRGIDDEDLVLFQQIFKL